MEETSLSDFGGAGDGADEPDGTDDRDGGGTAGDRDGDDRAGAAADPDREPGVDEGSPGAGDPADHGGVTYAWSPAGAACAACGAVVPRRWGADGRLVCGDCKEW